eukprot:ANDGO_06681.mRNA.1 UPF0317 protein BLi00500/BL02808
MFESPADLRASCRTGEYTSHTSGQCPGFKQANIVIVSSQYASQFLEFCNANPQACPVLAVSKPGEASCSQLADASDIRTDLPLYSVYVKGKLVDTPTDISVLFNDQDSVVFYLGCSFSFERALQANGIEVQNIVQKKNVPMYKTNIPCVSVGPFATNLVVSYRPIRKDRVLDVTAVCEGVKQSHGGPVHVGNPADIGIADLANPDFGDALDAYPGTENDEHCFWACGVTATQAVVNAKLGLVITHSPGCMFVTDVPDSK